MIGKAGRCARFALVVITCVAATQVAATPAMADQVRDSQWHLQYLKIAEAHRITEGSGVTVAVVDSGVGPHRDLKRNLLAGVSVVPGISGNGQKDESGHGTAMAGLIAGHGAGRNAGVLGIAPDAKLLPIKSSGASHLGGSATISAGIEYAAQNGAKVINVSAASAPTAGLQKAVEAAAATDSLVVAGVGNRPKYLSVGFPAAIPGVLAVGAIDRSGKHASFSVEGAEVQLCAPGADMETTAPNNKYYGNYVGTSPATAVVSGAAALVRAKFPDLTAPQVIERLTSTATDIGPPGRDDECGFGVLNIVKALTADLPDGSSSSDDGDDAEAGAPAESPAADDVAQPADDGNGLVLVASVGGGLLVLAALAALLLLRRRGKT